jgi:hypothetical protein
MPIRKISIVETGYHSRGESEADRKWLRLNDVKDGLTFRRILKDGWDSSTFNDLGLRNQDRAIDLLQSEEVDGALVLSAMVGRVGEPGRVIESDTGKVIREDDDGTLAKQGLLRLAYFELDPDPIHGYYVVETTPNGNLDQALQKVVRTGFRAVDEKLTAAFAFLQNGQQWAEEQADLREILIVREKQSIDADDIGTIGCSTLQASVSIKPEKGIKRFAQSVLPALKSRDLKPTELIGFPVADPDENERIKVRLGEGKRSKLMDLDDLRGLNYQAIITDYGEETPDNETFVGICRNHLKTLLGSNSSR